SGRMPDASAPHEVAVNEVAAQYFDVGIGDQLVLHSYAPDQVSAWISGVREPFRGPTVEALVVGVFRTAEDVSDNSEPIVFLSKGFRESYGDRIVRCDCSFWIRTGPD